jgi:hypothetical protein
VEFFRAALPKRHRVTVWLVTCQVPALVSLSLLGEEYLERDIAIALCSLLLTESGSGVVAGGPGQKNILDMGALGALNSLARSDEEELQVGARLECFLGWRS